MGIKRRNIDSKFQIFFTVLVCASTLIVPSLYSSPESLYTTMTKSLPMCRFLLQQPLSLSLFGISVAM